MRFGGAGRGQVIIDGDMAGSTGHTSSRMTGRIEVISRISGRRSWTVEQKLAILRDAFGPGGSRRLAMERHEVNSGQLYTWRHQAMSGQLSGTPGLPAMPRFAEVTIVAPEQCVPALPSPSLPEAVSKIGIELPSGVKLSIDSDVDGAALARVLGILGR